ncbi:MAG: hypothetical protein JST11_07945 [Acidobacteria bacterium]|nr:hypothetical protein [Acidobacteriota bacterium]
MSRRRDTASAALMATLGAALIIAHQAGARAVRETLFLDSFRSQSLPSMMIVAAVFSIAVASLVSRAMAAQGPARLVPSAFVASAMLHLGEWGLVFQFPRIVAVVFYLHFSGLGLVLISGFWSLVNERFDPYAAKKRMAGIAGGAAFGSVAGGGIAWAAGKFLTPAEMLPVLCLMHLACAWILRAFQPLATCARPATAATGGPCAGARMIGAHPYLRYLALQVFLGAVGAALIYVVFMARVQATIQDRLPFFALFYTCTNLLSLLIQSTVTRLLLEKAGLGVTAGAHPAAIVLGSLGAALAPGLGGATFGKGSEHAVHNSLFRSAYELFYTPLPPGEKRCVKPLIDVAFERLGDIAGSLVSRSLLLLGPALAQPFMLAAAAGVGLAGLLIARRLDCGYVAELERSLRSRAVELDLEDVTDHTTRLTLIRTRVGLPARPEPGRLLHPETRVPPTDPLLRRIADLHSGDPPRVRRALGEAPIDSCLAAHTIALLGWNEVAQDAMDALRNAGPAITGELVDALLDPSTDFAVRRRIPRILGGFPSARAFAGLVGGLEDQRFEVRYHCGRALASILGRDSAMSLSHDDVYRAVSRELEVDRHLWESHRLLDPGDEDQLIGDRANRGLEHVFTLLSTVLPKEPLRISFYALHTGDEMLRGTALEYLDNVLPPPVRERLWSVLEDKHPTKHAGRTHDEVLAALLESHASIQEKLLELRGKL